jgi:hypothetical protein
MLTQRAETILHILGPTASSTTGTAPYSYAWTKRGGSGDISITRANTAQVEFSSTGLVTTNYASFRCTVTDANGSVGTVDVNITVNHLYPTHSSP